MKVKFSKVRITDHRPPGAGAQSPLERGSATRGGSVAEMDFEKRMAAEHDRNVAGYSPELVAAAYDAIEHLPVTITKDMDREERMERIWLRHRKAALLRLGMAMRKRGAA